MSTVRATTAVAAAALVAALVAVPPAVAKDGDVRVKGTCTTAATSKLKLSREDGRIEIEFEVDQNQSGVRWAVTLRRNGVVVASRTAVTRAPSGSFEVRRLLAGTAGGDRIVATATSLSGARCTAGASL
jgi:hypothetical protein